MFPTESPDGQHLEYERFLAEATALLAAGDHTAALNRAGHALELNPESPRAHQTTGAAAGALGDLETAADHYALASHFSPDNEAILIGYADVLEWQGRGDRAKAILEDLVSRNPEFADAGFCLARLHYAVGAHDAAARRLQQNLRSQPHHASSLNLLGLIIAREYGDLGEGERLIRLALEAVPNFIAARSNLGWVLSEQGHVDEALACFEQVLSCDPQDAETRLMRAYAFLKNGQFAEGWKDFGARHASPLAQAHKDWLAEQKVDSIAGKKILICAEQGLGDQIMFASCIPDLLASGASGALECDQRLIGLFRRSFPALEVFPQPFAKGHVAWEAYGLGAEMRIPIGSLPGYFRQKWGDFPAQAAYLQADPEKTAAWRSRYAELGPGPYVGVSWLGGAQTTRRQLRTIPLTDWADVLSMPGTFISLQYGDCTEEVAAMREGRLHHWPEALADYDETAAMVAALDMVISVCTAVVHLAGALGVPVWVLTPATPEWRYLGHGDRIPWYPSARLFRQAPGEPWTALLGRVGLAYRNR